MTPNHSCFCARAVQPATMSAQPMTDAMRRKRSALDIVLHSFGGTRLSESAIRGDGLTGRANFKGFATWTRRAGVLLVRDSDARALENKGANKLCFVTTPSRNLSRMRRHNQESRAVS